MPGYGLAPSEAGLLPWSWAVERLTNSRNYWIATVHPAGRPHVMPVWAVWIEDTLLFSMGLESRRVRNLAANPHCTATVESGSEAVIVEGTVTRGVEGESLRAFLAAYRAKYDWDLDAAQIEGIFVLHPRVVFGFIEAAAHFSTSATRWTFDG